MSEMMKKMLMAKKGKTLSPIEKTAKEGVLNQLKQDMQDMLRGKLHGLKKVTVAAPNEEGMEKGLDTAKHLLATHTGHDEPDKSVEDDEETLGEDLDHDDESGESEEHKDKVFRDKPNESNPMHNSHESDEDEAEKKFFDGGEVGDFEPYEGNFDPEDEDNEEALDAKIEELMKKKANLKKLF